LDQPTNRRLRPVSPYAPGRTSTPLTLDLESPVSCAQPTRRLRNPTGDERKRHPVEELIYESSILLDARDFKGFLEEPVSWSACGLEATRGKNSAQRPRAQRPRAQRPRVNSNSGMSLSEGGEGWVYMWLRRRVIHGAAARPFIGGRQAARWITRVHAARLDRQWMDWNSALLHNFGEVAFSRGSVAGGVHLEKTIGNSILLFSRSRVITVQQKIGTSILLFSRFWPMATDWRRFPLDHRC
jgi:hypothetical protein